MAKAFELVCTYFLNISNSDIEVVLTRVNILPCLLIPRQKSVVLANTVRAYPIRNLGWDLSKTVRKLRIFILIHPLRENYLRENAAVELNGRNLFKSPK